MLLHKGMQLEGLMIRVWGHIALLLVAGLTRTSLAWWNLGRIVIWESRLKGPCLQ